MTELLVEIADGIAELTLNRPERRNAFTASMGRRLSATLDRCDRDDAVRVIVLTGAAGAFCAGADLSTGADTFAAPDTGFSASPIDPPAFRLRTPVIAAVNGHAIGIGLTIALQADLRIMATDAKYGVLQVRRGVLGDAMSHWLLPRIAGAAVAAEILLTGRSFDGPQAQRWGIANECLPAAEVLDRARVLAADIRDNTAPRSVALSKRLLWESLDAGWSADRVAEAETVAHRRLMGSPDAHEGVAAYLERRPARWTGRVSDDPDSW